ncbi:MAG TPA: hypothetical protein VFR41_02325 [Acidimicrobiia bacterium]|nr:hypothetical protein [Acidimicrobiia bacterium]
MRQLLAELRRFTSRRLVRVVAIATVAIGIIWISGATFVGHSPTRAEMQNYQEQVKLETQQLQNPDGSITFFRPGIEEPRDTRVNLKKHLSPTITGVSYLLVFVAVILGASFVGAEFGAGSLTTQLLYEPRRWRVHLSKAVTVFGGTAALSLWLSSAIAVALTIGAHLHGVTAGADGAWWVTRIGQIFREAATVGFAGAMAYTVALMARRTTAAVIIFFAQFPALFLIDPHKGVLRWFSRYSPMRALMYLATAPKHDNLGQLFETIRTMGGAIVLALIWLAILTVISGLAFSRAEVR